MPCINLDLNFFSHRKVLRLTARLGSWAEIIPIKLWVYTGRFHPEDGMLLGYSDAELLTIMGINFPPSSNATSIVQAMLAFGFLVVVDGGYQVHQWADYQGHIANFAARGKAAAKIRWAKMNEFNGNNATSMLQAMLDQDPSNALTSLTSLTELSKSKEKEDVTKPPKRFVRPSISEISEYCLERKNGISPTAFFDSYEAKGWKVGTTPMKDWKACVRTWEQRKLQFSQGTPKTTSKGLPSI